MHKYLAAAIGCGCATVLAAQAPPSESLNLARGSQGELVATLQTAGDAVVVFDFARDGCYFNPEHSESCFSFLAINGTEPMKVQGCVPNIDGKLGIAGSAGCRASDFKSVRLVAPSGGTFSLYGGNGSHNDCSPVPVTIEMHGNAWHIATWNGCTETIDCAGGLGQIDADAGDDLNPNCSSAFVTRHTRE